MEYFWTFVNSFDQAQFSYHKKQLLCNIPGIVNRTFENRTQSNSIELNPWIEFD